MNLICTRVGTFPWFRFVSGSTNLPVKPIRLIYRSECFTFLTFLCGLDSWLSEPCGRYTISLDNKGVWINEDIYAIYVTLSSLYQCPQIFVDNKKTLLTGEKYFSFCYNQYFHQCYNNYKPTVTIEQYLSS